MSLRNKRGHRVGLCEKRPSTSWNGHTKGTAQIGADRHERTEPRRRIDVALHAVIMQAWVEGVSTRRVDDLVTALAVTAGISKSEVSWICSQLDTEVAAWRARPLGEGGKVFPSVLEGRHLLPRPGGGRRARQGRARHQPGRRDRDRGVR